MDKKILEKHLYESAVEQLTLLMDSSDKLDVKIPLALILRDLDKLKEQFEIK